MNLADETAPRVHPTAVVADGTEVAATAKIGPYCVVGRQVVVDDRDDAA